jgi:hypothetical protein
MKAALLVILSLIMPAGDPQFWGHYPPSIQGWFPKVMQPGFENDLSQGHSCCGVADAFEARVIGEDRVTGDIIVVIDDGKGVIPDGIQVHAPRKKIQVNYGNPTGKLIIFIGGGLTVYCLIPQTEG